MKNTLLLLILLLYMPPLYLSFPSPPLPAFYIVVRTFPNTVDHSEGRTQLYALPFTLFSMCVFKYSRTS